MALQSVPGWFLKRSRSRAFIVGAGVITTGAWFMEMRSNELERRFPDNEEFQLPRTYAWQQISSYWLNRPISIIFRAAQVLYELGPVGTQYALRSLVFKTTATPEAQKELAAHFREALTNLGACWVKGGQQLSIRPDLVSPIVLKELQKLCDEVRPVPDEVAFSLIREELGIQDLDTVFYKLERVAAASLGQVYHANLFDKYGRPSDEEVAIKVQRPDMQRRFSLDLFVLQNIGAMIDTFTSVFTQQPPFHQALYESFASGSYSELDYENEAENQIRFKIAFEKRKCPVVIPSVYEKYTSQRVLTTEWIEGVKLADSPKDVIRELTPVGVELFLTQLLDIGLMHCDAHPGMYQCDMLLAQTYTVFSSLLVQETS